MSVAEPCENAGPGLLSQSEPVAYFGLGERTVAAELVARWPDGRLQVLRDLAANQILELTPPPPTVVGPH